MVQGPITVLGCASYVTKKRENYYMHHWCDCFQAAHDCLFVCGKWHLLFIIYPSDSLVDIETDSEPAHVCRTPYRRSCNVERDAIDANASNRIVYRSRDRRTGECRTWYTVIQSLWHTFANLPSHRLIWDGWMHHRRARYVWRRRRFFVVLIRGSPSAARSRGLNIRSSHSI